MPLSKLICKGFEFLCGLNRDHWGRETIPLWNSPREERIPQGITIGLISSILWVMPEFVSILLQGLSICLYQRKPVPNGFYRKRLKRTAPGGIPGTAIPARPADHQHYSHSAISCRSTSQPSSEPSLPAEPVLTHGCQMGAAYSTCGRIKVLYAAAFVSLGAKVKLCRRNPIQES